MFLDWDPPFTTTHSQDSPRFKRLQEKFHFTSLCFCPFRYGVGGWRALVCWAPRSLNQEHSGELAVSLAWPSIRWLCFNFLWAQFICFVSYHLVCFGPTKHGVIMCHLRTTALTHIRRHIIWNITLHSKCIVCLWWMNNTCVYVFLYQLLPNMLFMYSIFHI